MDNNSKADLINGSKCINCGGELGRHRAKDLACPLNPDIYYSGPFEWNESSLYKDEQKDIEERKEEYKKIISHLVPIVDPSDPGKPYSKMAELWSGFPETAKEELRKWNKERERREKAFSASKSKALPEKKKLKAHDIKLPEPPDGWSWSPSPFSGNFNFTLDGPSSGNFVKSIDSGIFCFGGRRFEAKEVAKLLWPKPSQEDLDLVFWDVEGDTPELRAKNSSKLFIYSDHQIAEYTGKGSGQRVSASEALKDYGFETLLEVMKEGQALIAKRKMKIINNVSVPIKAAKVFMMAAFPEIWNFHVRNFDFGEGLVPAKRHQNPDGTIGGWVAETALVEKSAFVRYDAKVFDKAIVLNNAYISGKAKIFGNAQVSNSARVYNSAKVFGNAKILNHAQVYGDAAVCEDAIVSDCALVFENALVAGYSNIYDYALIFGKCSIFENARVFGKAQICGDSIAKGDARVSEMAKINKSSIVDGKAKIKGKCKIIDQTFSFDFSYSDIISNDEEKELIEEKEKFILSMINT